jgi:copper chaperone CopZ
MQTVRYEIFGMTCNGCAQAVTRALRTIPEVVDAHVDHASGFATVTSTNALPNRMVQEAVQKAGFKFGGPGVVQDAASRQRKFLPLFIAFTLVFIWTVSHEISSFDFMRAMDNFMGAFFILFGLMKVVNWSGFAKGFSGYDLLAKRSKVYAYAYPAIELMLGMLLGAIGVSQALQKNAGPIQCACLGGFFQVPLSNITVFEDLLMGGMALLGLMVHFAGGQTRLAMTSMPMAGMMTDHVRWSAACLGAGLFYIFRLVFGKRLLPKYDFSNELCHGLMGIAMAGMFFPSQPLGDPKWWLYAFWAITAWYIGRCAIRKRLSDKRLKGHLIHAVMAGGMVYMLMPTHMRPALTYAFELFFAVFTADYLSVAILNNWNAKPRNIWWVFGDLAHAIMGGGMMYMLIAM